MTNEILDTINKLIKPEDISISDDAVIRQLSDNLQDITPEEVDGMCDEIEEAKRNQKEKKNEEEQKKEVALQELMDFRETWETEIDLDDSAIDLITKAAEDIPVKIEIESDWSRLVEFKLWDKTYKILDPKLKTHSDPEYFDNTEYSFIGKRDEWVELWWMMWDVVDDWENQKLKEFVKQKKREWLHIPRIEEMEKLLKELWHFADLRDEEEEIAMLMYLTGLDWDFWLSMWDDMESGNEDSRTILICGDVYGDIVCWFDCTEDKTDNASLLMISSKWDGEDETSDDESEVLVIEGDGRDDEDDEDDDEFL